MLLKFGMLGGLFLVGVNFEEVMFVFMMGGVKGIELFVKKF